MIKSSQFFSLRNAKIAAVALLFAGGLASCEKENEDNSVSGPQILSFEYGEGSTHSTEPFAFRGSDLHLEADIEAPAKVASISIDIHAHDLTPGDGEVEWDFEQTFTDEKYLAINPTFHEHIDIPETAPAGEYHITITVVDAEGNETETEGHLEIYAEINVSDIAIDETVTRGNELHAEFILNALHGIHHVIIDIHAHGITPGAGEVEWDFEGEFEDGYHGETSVEFHEHIEVPATAPAGEYHMEITIEDEEGNIYSFEQHVDVAA